MHASSMQDIELCKLGKNRHSLYACCKLFQPRSRDIELDNRPHKEWNCCCVYSITVPVGITAV